MSSVSSPTPDLHTRTALTALLEARGTPCRVLEDEPFLGVLRLVVASRCGRGCHYPDGSAVWCHAEGVTRETRQASTLQDFVGVARDLGARLGIRRVKIAGLEPEFDDSFVPFFEALRDAGFDCISITTHDDRIVPYLERYRRAGLTQLSVSIPHLRQAQFARIAYTGTSAGLFGVVEHARRAGLQPVKINRVLQRGFTDDVAAVLDWARARDVTVKFFELMWTAHAGSSLPRFQVPWTEFLPLWLDATSAVELRHYPLSHRTRVSFRLRGGGGVEVNLMENKRAARAGVCADCTHAAHCAEGYLGCGVRVMPDLSLLPCLLRPESASRSRPVTVPAVRHGWRACWAVRPPASHRPTDECSHHRRYDEEAA